MMQTAKPARKRNARRKLFEELTEGMNAIAEAREGTRTLRTHSIEFKPTPSGTPEEHIGS